MSTTLPYRPSTKDSTLERQNSLNSFPASAASSGNPNNGNKLPRLSPAASVLGRSPSSRTSSRPRSAHGGQARKKRYKSQYPLDSPERHVEYILVASFHIDRGPIMEHQYPAAISGDESMLAELMLPDQTHVRSQDWTIFFLHKDTSEDDEDEAQREEKKSKRRNKDNGAGEDPDWSSDEESSDGDEDGSEGPPLMYVLNLVNTKQDNTVRRYVFPQSSLPLCPANSQSRGAVVKAMAICTRHSFLHIYKVCLNFL